jgi:uncharacterized protein with HEPN domain
MNIPQEVWLQIDEHLSRSKCLPAMLLYMEVTGCGIGEAKKVISIRFRERFPDLCKNYREVWE